MDVTAAPTWGFGLPPVDINPLPATFVAFFPTDLPTARPASTDGGRAPGAMPEETYWTGHLANPPPVCRPPAWERVPIQAKAGTIMKRVAVLAYEPDSPYSLQAAAEARSLADAPKSSRQKLLHRPWDGLRQHRGFGGAPLTEATITSLRMQARVNVANAILVQSNMGLPSEASEYKTVPAKRSLQIADNAEEQAKSGNKLPLYLEIRPLLEMAAENGTQHIDLPKASYAHSTAILQNLRRNPRTPLVADGAPDLSDIADVTEPLSPHVMSPPRINADAKSPTKRDLIPSSPLQSSCTRLKAAKVDLLPTASPKIEPSPVKPASVSSTPLKDVFSTKLTATPSLASPAFSLHQASDEPSWLVHSPYKLPQQEAPSSTKVTASPIGQMQTEISTPSTYKNQPGKTFRLSSFFDSTDLSPEPSYQPEPEHSPSKFARPVAPTPSKWNRIEAPCTPLLATPGPNEPLGLVASIPFGTPEVGSESFNSCDISDFDFGPHSLVFATCTAEDDNAQAEKAQRAKELHVRRRRQSEPFLKTAFKAQQRRRSASPMKLSEKAADAANEQAISSSPVAAPDTTQKPLELADIIHLTPLASNALGADATPNSLARGSNKLFTNTPTTAAEQTPATAAADADQATVDNAGVLNIDVRQNPDIFSIHNPINQLAHMAQGRCDGQANVLTSYVNGRLVVRFKLPIEYASMFPESQGFDESCFTSSPPAISSSPRIRFEQPQASQTPSQSREANPFVSTEPKLKPVSPVKLAYSSPSRPTRSSPLKMPPLTQSPIEPPSTGKRSALWEPLSTCSPNDETLIVNDFGASNLNQSSPFKHVEETPLAERSNLFMDTPSMNGVGVVSRDTPEHLRHSSPYQGTPLVFTPDVRNTVTPSFTPTFGRPSQFGKGLQTPTCAESFIVPSSATSTATQPPQETPSSPALQAQDSPQQAATPSVEKDTTPPPQDNVEVATPPANDAKASTPESSPPLNLSFTPVNQNSSRSNTPQRSPEAAAEPETNGNATASADEDEDKASSPSPAERPSAVVDDDSPGREHMRKFIERSKSKRQSTLETGSPVGQTAERTPLGVKSPNAASPLKAKRKLKDDDAESPPKKAAEPVAKRTRRTLRGSKEKAEEDDVDELAGPETDALVVQAPEDDDAATEDAPSTRRSKRLRPLDRPASANSKLTNAKSAIPTLKYRSGAGRGGTGPVLNAAVRTEQQELMHQTRLNTRRNKGGAEYPQQVLARRSQELQDDEAQEKAAEQAKAAAKNRKTVGWREPLEAHQEKPKKGRPATTKTAKPSGITKPRGSAATKKEEVVEARPQRMTRSRTRSQV